MDNSLLSNPDKFSQLVEAINSVKEAKSSAVSVPRLIGYTTLTAISGLGGYLFYGSTGEAMARYHRYTKGTRFDFIFQQNLPGWSGALTNFFFNLETYLWIWEQAQNKKLNNEEALTQNQHLIKVWLFATIAGIGTVLPSWIAALDSSTDFMLATLAAICDLPVNIAGAKLLVDWARTTRLVAGNDEIANTRRKIVAKLRQRAAAIRANGEREGDGTINIEQLTAIYNDESETEIINHHFCCTATLMTLKSAIWLIALYQNYGAVYFSYKDAAKIQLSLGLFALFANLIPSLGFTIKGMTGLVLPMAEGNFPITFGVQHHSKKFWLCFTLLSLIAAGSGFTAGQMGYEAWEQLPGWGGENAKLASDIVSNVGAVVIYNFPQCLLFLNRLFELYQCKIATPEQQQAYQYADKLEQTADVVEKMKDDAINELTEEGNVFASHVA